MDIDLLDNLLFAMVRTGTPLLLVALGELVCERSGVLNLGQEGMMLFGAVIGFMVAFSSGSLWLGVLLAVLAGMLLAALPAINTVPPVNSPPSAASRAAVALSRLGIRTSVRRSTSRKSLPVRPTKVSREEPSPDTSKLTGMVPP